MSPAPKILTVDDNDAHRYFVCRTLEQGGFQTVAVSSGSEALLKARELPDLVLLDVRLPDFTGFEICRRLKADPETKRIPIVMFSEMEQSGAAVNDALQLGASSFLFFPVAPSHLLTVVQGSLATAARAPK